MATKQPSVAITGANGFLGSALVKHFGAKGWHVFALVRSPEQHTSTQRITYKKYDITEPLGAGTLPAGLTYLIHTAYVPHTSKNPRAYTENIKAAEAIATAAEAYGVKKTLFMSTMSAHSGAESVYGKQKLQIEKIFSTDRGVVVRSGLIIGNGGIVRKMADFMRSKHMAPLIGGGKQPLQIIALQDLIQVIEKSLITSLAGTYTVANPRVYTYKEFYQSLARRLHVKVVFIPLPFFLLITLLRIAAKLPLPLAVSADNALGLKHLIAVDNRRDMQALGIKAMDLDSALRVTASL